MCRQRGVRLPDAAAERGLPKKQTKLNLKWSERAVDGIRERRVKERIKGGSTEKTTSGGGLRSGNYFYGLKEKVAVEKRGAGLHLEVISRRNGAGLSSPTIPWVLIATGK